MSSIASHSSSSTIKYSEFAESRPSRANLASGSTICSGKSSVRARYLTHQSRIADSLGFSDPKIHLRRPGAPPDDKTAFRNSAPPRGSSAGLPPVARGGGMGSFKEP